MIPAFICVSWNHEGYNIKTEQHEITSEGLVGPSGQTRITYSLSKDSIK